MTLNERALNVSQLAANFKDWQERAEQVGSLATRREQLKTIAAKLRALAVAAEVLSHEPSASSDLEIVRRYSEQLKARADNLVQKIKISSEALLRPKALEMFEGDALATVERTLTSAWRTFLGVDGQLRIETALSRFIGLRDVVKRIGTLRQDLQTLSSRLPSGLDDLEKGRILKARLAQELSSLTGSGLSPDIESFLRRSVDGVSLTELLSNQALVRWLNDQDLTQYFHVRSI